MSDHSRRDFLRSVSAAAAIGAAPGRAQSIASDLPAHLHFETGFVEPPAEASPWIYWYWMNANVSREGITADLESMKANGIALVYLFSIGAKIPGVTRMQPAAEPLSPLWWDLVKFAAVEAERLGLKLGLNACDGWATAGGPWITPELSMQKLVWSEQRVTGGRRFIGTLPKPTAVLDYYQDVAVLALPVPSTWNASALPETAKVTTSLPVQNPESILNAKDGELSVDTDEAGWIQFEFAEPFTCRSVTIYTVHFNPPAQTLVIEASDDGSVFHRVLSMESPKNGWQTVASHWTHSVPQTTARFFRFVYNPPKPQPYAEDFNFIGERRLRLTRIELSGLPRINQYEGKSGTTWTSGRRTTDADAPPEVCVPLQAIANITKFMISSGELSWDAPEGEWLILRFGHTTTGMRNDPAGAGQGLECDKFNPEAARVQFQGWFGQALSKLGPELSAKVLKIFHVDSWECGSQNWSPVFCNAFRRRRGYDLLLYLPAMRGIPVESADISERFLLDIRRTIAELFVDHFFEPLSKLSHENGCLFSAECTAPTMVGDGMLHYSTVDLPMGEFWLNTIYHDKPNDIRDAVSGAHVYGKQIVQCESFTEGHIDWSEHPFKLKALGDHNYCAGMNRFVLHVYAHQAWPDRKPGVTLSTVGTFFSHTNTSWLASKSWFDYLRRCQFLLQYGRHVADVCYFSGENIPSRALLPSRLDPPLPAGYAYDSINRDALLRAAKVNNGEIVLDGGARYGLFVVSEARYLTPEVVNKLRDLVAAGATVMSSKPVQSPSLEHYPSGDREVAAASRSLWGECDGVHVQENRFGQGRIVCGKNIESVLSDLHLLPDVEIGSDNIEWVHRQAPGWDVYFLSNQSSTFTSVEVSFRISNQIPELWHPDTGVVEEAPVWGRENHRTFVRLDLDPAGSIFVVFRRSDSVKKPTITEILPSGQIQRKLALILQKKPEGYEAWTSVDYGWTFATSSGRNVRTAAPKVLAAVAIRGPWTVEFMSGDSRGRAVQFDELGSWTQHTDPDIRFFSGTARYTTTFSVPNLVSSPQNRLFLDLGDVACLASIKVNGKAVGTLWKPPFSLEVTQVLVAGWNQLSIEVTNTWKNRLIGDEALVSAQRTSWLLFDQAHPPKDATLDIAGLIGPVQLRVFVPLLMPSV